MESKSELRNRVLQKIQHLAAIESGSLPKA